MKKQFKLDEIDCANCARKLQDELAKLEGVKSVSVNFMTQKLTLEADDAEFDEVLDRVVEFTADAEVLRRGATALGEINDYFVDLIEVRNAGAYACTLTAQRFSSHTPPRELLVYGDGRVETE